MLGYAQQFTTATAALTKGALATALGRATGERSDRPRPVSEILDLRRTFVAGYPRHVADDQHADLG